MIDFLAKLYRAGWRPLIGWVTVLVIFVLFVVCSLFQISAPDKIYDHLNELFFLAGVIGGCRSYDKKKAP